MSSQFWKCINNLEKECQNLFKSYQKQGLQAFDLHNKQRIQDMMLQIQWGHTIKSVIDQHNRIKLPYTNYNLISHDQENYNAGIFVVEPKHSIPLHDHPNMLTATLIIYGEGTLTTYNKSGAIIEGNQQVVSENKQFIVKNGEFIWTEPIINNIHSFYNHSNDCFAFLDVFIPHYEHENRNITFYKEGKSQSYLEIKDDFRD